MRQPIHQTDRNRILIGTDAWEPQVNGVVRTLQATILELNKRGISVEVIDPAQFRRVSLPTYPDIQLACVTPAMMRRKLEQIKPDYVHIATEGPIGWALRSACLAAGKRFSTSYHTRFPEYLSARMPVPENWVYPLFRRFHAAAERTLVSTPRMAKELEERGFKNLALWSRGVDTAMFHPRAQSALNAFPRPIFLTVSRLAVEKNLEAFLALDLPGSKLVVGNGPAAEMLRNRFPDAHFLGMKSGSDLADVYANADVFVFPSKTDTFGMVLLEAAASGLPVAAFPVPGPMDVMGNSNAAVLDEDLRKACLQALTLQREACLAFAGKHSWSSATDQFLSAIALPDMPPCEDALQAA